MKMNLKKTFVVFSIFSLALGIVELYPVLAKEPALHYGIGSYKGK